MADSAPEIIYGAAMVAHMTSEELSERFKVLQKHHVKSLDTAFIYVRRFPRNGKSGVKGPTT